MAVENNILIVFFSGTGGTKKIAHIMEQVLIKNGFDVTLYSLDLSIHKSFNIQKETIRNSKYLIILYPVYSFDAPKPVFEWIENLPYIREKLTVVISVSGGGDIFVNKSCRVTCIQELEEKGYKVFYEKMMVMPSNFVIKANDDLNMWLIKFIPIKVNEIIEEILANKSNRIGVKKTKIKKSFGQKEHKHIKKFGLSLYADDTCISCSWCVNNCPRNNIKINNDKPEFMDKCIMCMRCIYGCPANAITSSKYKYTILKDGYNLKELENDMKDRELKSIEKCGKGILWKGVRKYLQNI